ncbi:hypothetical protein RHSIM_Rhsim03G0022000 [Rhododendron simsii]|uniref:Uncharacterized protein n=1 Tax=Rhododendron simsii TaxID=118357 RepID=A0A834H4R0_RHOSS|nr:hypothetical protein RHSIM_Rhsim03G0022000 [Rhododendron simsii]
MDQPPQLQPPKTFYLGDLLIGPLNFAILVYSPFPNPLLSQVDSNSSQWTKLLFCYLISHFAFPLLSLLSAIVFTRIASLKRLFTTQLWVSLAMVLYNAAFLGFGPRALTSFADTTPVMGRIMSALSILFVSEPLLHADDAMLWRLASLPEPIYGAVAAMEKSKLGDGTFAAVRGNFLQPELWKIMNEGLGGAAVLWKILKIFNCFDLSACILFSLNFPSSRL